MTSTFLHQQLSKTWPAGRQAALEGDPQWLTTGTSQLTEDFCRTICTGLRNQHVRDLHTVWLQAVQVVL